MAQDTKPRQGGGPMDRLKSEAAGLVGALGDRAVAGLRDKVQDATGRLTDYVDGGAGPGLMSAVTGAKNMAEGKGPVRSMLGAGAAAVKEKVRGMFGKGGGKGKKIKITNIVETLDVGVPITLAYNQWTQFADFPSFMKKVETVEQAEDEKLNWKAQVFWSHRTWESSILEQHPDDKIIWRSKGPKGYVDGAVTFHELAPNLTRILVVLEYHPQGFMERTGNIWRAQGRRVRLELKHFRRHVMSDSILHPDEIEGWRGVIEDGEVVQQHEPASEGDQEDREGAPEDQDEFAGEPDESEEDDEQEEYAGAEARDEADEEPEPDAEDDAGEPEEADRPSRSRRAAASRRESGTSSRVPAPRPRRAAASSRSEQQRPQRSTRRAPASGGRSK